MILPVLLFALILRLIKLDQSLWWDEAINVTAARGLDFWTFVTQYPVGDFHPPLYFALLWLWGHLFGFSENISRLPSVIFGLATIATLYLFGKEIASKKVGLLAALLLAAAPLHVYYSQEARVYSLGALVTTLSFYFLSRLINRKKYAAWGYSISLVLLLYGDYLPYLVFPTQIIFLFWAKRNFLKRVLLYQLGAVLTLTPWLPIFKLQLKTGVEAAALLPNWAEVVGGGEFKNLILLFVKTVVGRISFENKIIYGVAVSLPTLIYGLLIFNSVKKANQATKILICWLGIPIFLALLISVWVPVFSYFRLLFILPALYLLAALGLDQLSKKYLLTVLFFLIGCSLFFLGIFYTNPKFQREDWRGAISKIESMADQDSVIVFTDNNIPAAYHYYSRSLATASAGLWRVPASFKQDIIDYTNKSKIYLFEYLVEINDPQRFLQKSLEKEGFKKIDTYNFNGVGFVYIYEH